METNELIAAEIAATADAIRDADHLVLDTTTTPRVIRLEAAPVFTTCLAYYNEGPCPHCEGN